jgi:hypothetical protein
MINNDVEDIANDIINFNPPLAKELTEDQYHKYILNSNFSMILKILSKGHMTIKEVHKQFLTKIVKEKELITDIDLIEDKSGKEIYEYFKNSRKIKLKTENSIYYYLRELQKGGLVIQSGQRVFFGQILNPILYSRTARIFYYTPETEMFWREDQGQVITSLIGHMLSEEMNHRDHNVKKLIDFLSSFRHERNQILENILETLRDEDIIQQINDFTIEEFSAFFETLILIKWFLKDKNNQRFLLELDSCFQ